MPERLIEIARCIQEQPWNRPGVDKTWVLRAMWEHRKFQTEVRGAGRTKDVGAH